MGVPSLVHFTTTHRVGGHCILLVSQRPTSADCTCVGLIDLATMGPAIVARERPGCQASLRWSRCRHQSCRSCQSRTFFSTRQRVRSFLLAAIREVTNAVSSRLAAVSCWRTVVSFEAASARFSKALPMRSMVSSAVGITMWALPRSLPPPKLGVGAGA
jgi:hypothetical protein